MADGGLSAITSAANAIRSAAGQSMSRSGYDGIDYNIERSQPPGTKRRYGGPTGIGRQAAFRVELNAGAVAYGMMNLGLALNVPAMSAISQRAGLLQADIRSFTPHGVARDLPFQLSNTIPARSHEAPSDNSSMKIWKREAAGLLQQLENLSGSAPDMAMIQKAHEILRSEHRFYRPPTYNLEKEFGSLYLSIQAEARQKLGNTELEAWSDNYYAGFVEEGFNHGLEPVMQFAGENGKIAKRGGQASTWIHLSLARLGFGGAEDKRTDWMDFSGESEGDDGQVVQFGYAWDLKTMELSKGAPQQTMISWRPRTQSKTQPGVHMFAKGMEKFLSEQAPAWRRDVDQIFRQAWDRGMAWYDIDKQFRMRKGAPGGTGGQYSTKRPG
jgi:hypothetical protein